MVGKFSTDKKLNNLLKMIDGRFSSLGLNQFIFYQNGIDCIEIQGNPTKHTSKIERIVLAIPVHYISGSKTDREIIFDKNIFSATAVAYRFNPGVHFKASLVLKYTSSVENEINLLDTICSLIPNNTNNGGKIEIKNGKYQGEYIEKLNLPGGSIFTVGDDFLVSYPKESSSISVDFGDYYVLTDLIYHLSTYMQRQVSFINRRYELTDSTDLIQLAEKIIKAVDITVESVYSILDEFLSTEIAQFLNLALDAIESFIQTEN